MARLPTIEDWPCTCEADRLCEACKARRAAIRAVFIKEGGTA